MTKRNKIIFFLSLCMLFILWSCRQDLYPVTEKQNGQRFIVERRSSTELQKHSNLIKSVNAIEEKLKTKKHSTFAKYENTTFNVNLNDALYIEDTSNNNHSYIFRIDDANSSSYDLENLVLKPNSSNGYDAFLVTYTLTETERNTIANGHNVDVSNKTTIQSLNSNNVNIAARGGSTCYELVIYGETDCTCHTTHEPGGCTHPDTLYEWVQKDCGGGSSGGTGDTGGTGDNGGTSGSGGTGAGTGTSGSGDPGILITPDGQVINNPCANVTKENKEAKNIYNQSSVQFNINQIDDTIPTDTVEKGFTFGIKPIDNSFGVSSIKTGTSTGVDLPATDANFNAMGSVHTHPGLDSFDSFSIADFYGLCSANQANQNFSTIFVLGATGEVYSLIITDVEKFKQFANLFPKTNHMDNTNGWKKGSPIEEAFMDAFDNMFKEQGKSADEAYALANAYVLKKFNAGMSISKKNSNGDFETLFVEEKKDPIDDTKTIYEQTSTCNL